MTIATGNVIDADDLLDGANLPTGLIFVWHGTIASIPSGFVICDGNNGTPNLLTRFLEGVATAGTNPGSTGGATAKVSGGHDHGGATSSHSHILPLQDSSRFTIGDVWDESPPWTLMGGRKISGPSSGGSVYPAYSSAASDTLGSDTLDISDVRPPYYDVAFIMKT